MADEKQLLWNHYQQLSDEIKSADTLNYQIIGVVVAASVALLNAAFGRSSLEDRCWILFSVYAVTIPGRFLLQVARTRIWRVASYLEIFVEPRLNVVRWQQRLNRRTKLTPLRTNIIRTEFSLLSGLDIVAGALVIASASGIAEPTREYFTGGAIVFMAHAVFRACTAQARFDRLGQIHRENREIWAKMLREDHTNLTP